ncbi:MAG: MqnA/MqnD/SBP family protein [Bacteroidota bacterium]
MEFRIGIPESELYRGLIERAEEYAPEFGYTIIKADDRQLSELMRTNRLDAALLTPRGYGEGVRDADYRIVPGSCLATEDYTRLASIFFRPGLKTISSCGCHSPEKFLMLMGQILLAEKYGIVVELTEDEAPLETLLNTYDAAIVWQSGGLDSTALDISEEWYTSYELPLPLAFWVVRNEEDPKDIDKFISMIKSPDLLREEPVIEAVFSGQDTSPRTGKLIWEWNEDVAKGLDHVLHLLYYLQLAPEVSAVKILGDEVI